MNSCPPLSLHSFLKGVYAIEVIEGIAQTTAESSPIEQTLIERVCANCLQSGLPAISQTEEGEPEHVAMGIPVYRTGDIVSIAVFVGDATESSVGVFETWQPIGQYDELNLTQGYFAGLDRFQNVSSFVRFEKGVGLPGQVWRNRSCIIHDNLPSHPGFLRAAGASAESLQVAIGIPVASENFLACALLISSDAAPIALGYEVWRNAGDSLVLESSAYQRLDSSLTKANEAQASITDSLAGLAVQRENTVVTDDPEILYHDRGTHNGGAKIHSGIAIPIFESDRVTHVLTLLM